MLIKVPQGARTGVAHKVDGLRSLQNRRGDFGLLLSPIKNGLAILTVKHAAITGSKSSNPIPLKADLPRKSCTYPSGRPVGAPLGCLNVGVYGEAYL